MGRSLDTNSQKLHITQLVALTNPEILKNLDANILVQEHLKQCDYQVCGYWDEQDEYYETITLPRNLEAELVSSSIGVTHTERFLQLKFSLVADDADATKTLNNNTQKIGELVLIYDDNLEFIDENWLLDIDKLCNIMSG